MSLDPQSLDRLFTGARTHNVWLDRPVPDALLRQAFELAKMGPTGGNSQPFRLVFVRSPAAKERLKPALMPLNVEKTMTAPVTVIVAHDLAYYQNLDRFAPHNPGMRDKVAGLPEPVRESMARQGATLEAGYFILAVRALGLDVGPMGGFDPAAVDKAFFEGTTWRANLLINVGYGNAEKLFPRQARLTFEEATRTE